MLAKSPVPHVLASWAESSGRTKWSTWRGAGRRGFCFAPERRRSLFLIFPTTRGRARRRSGGSLVRRALEQRGDIFPEFLPLLPLRAREHRQGIAAQPGEVGVLLPLLQLLPH